MSLSRITPILSLPEEEDKGKQAQLIAICNRLSDVKLDWPLVLCLVSQSLEVPPEKDTPAQPADGSTDKDVPFYKILANFAAAGIQPSEVKQMTFYEVISLSRAMSAPDKPPVEADSNYLDGLVDSLEETAPNA